MKKLLLSLVFVLFFSLPVSAETTYEHVWSEWTGSEATCSNDGYKTRHCQNDGCYVYESQTIPTTGLHNWSEWTGSEATCSNDGYKSRYCQNDGCYEYESQTIPTTGLHNWSDWTIPDYICGRDGYKYRDCVNDGCYSYENVAITATALHTWSEWEEDYSATCSYEGSNKRTCSGCDLTEHEGIPKIEHFWGEWETDTVPTCTYNGYESRSCSSCYEYESREIPLDSTNHDYSSWYTDKRATALKEGVKARECWDCENKETKTIEKLKAKVTLKKKTLSLDKKESYTLKIKSKTYGDKIKKWTSKNPKVATVNSKGKITGKKKGETTITLYMKSGAKVSCKVTVSNTTYKKPSQNRSTSTASGNVWIPRTGSKYHKYSSCSNMKKPSKTSLKNAKSWGYTACKKCY